jgi:D-alanyl-D-alanine dipeptidase
MSRTFATSAWRAGAWSRRASATALVLVLLPGHAAAQSAMPAGFVYLRRIDPTIAQDIRYAGSDNFIGRPLAGYDAPECILRRDVATALKQVQADLAGHRLALKVYDCYRPERAVRTMARWANDGRRGDATKRFFPRLEKGNLINGYIAARSRHSIGTAVDLTLVEAPRAPTASFDPAAAYGPCNGPAAQRAPDDSVDMGTGYDCLDADSHTSSTVVGAEQRRWRNRLVAAMAKHGFRNYFREWWHFEYAGSALGESHDFPIRPPAGKASPD